MSSLYKTKIIIKIFTSVIIYIILGLIEIIVYITFNINSSSMNDLNFDVNIIYILIKFINLGIALIVYFNFNKEYKISIPKYLIYILSVIPILSIGVIFFEILRKPVSDIYYLIAMALLFAINIFVAIIFVVLVNLFNERQKLSNINKDFEFLSIQRENVENSTRKLASLEHDLKNKLVPLYYLADSKINVEEYLSEIIGEFKNEFVISNTGIIEVDAIINSKYEICKQHNIDFKVDIDIPNDMNINHRDIGVILGNLLDNAIEGSLHANDRWIKLILRKELGALFIMVDNSYDGKFSRKGDEFLSRKNKEFSGIGLKNVKYLGEKYDAVMNISPDQNIFRVSILLSE